MENLIRELKTRTLAAASADKRSLLNIPSIEQKLASGQSGLLNTSLADQPSISSSSLDEFEPLTERVAAHTTADQARSLTPARDNKAFLDDNSVENGLGYLTNFIGAGVAGIGQLDNFVLSAPNILLNTADGLIKPADQKITDFVNETFPGVNDIAHLLLGAPSKLIRNTAQGLDQVGDTIEEGTAPFFNTVQVERLSRQVSQAYTDNTGAADVLVEMLSTTVNNKEALPQVLMQSIGIMKAMAQGGSVLAGTFVGLSGQRSKEAIQLYSDTHDGEVPTGKENAAIVAGAILSTTIEMVESRFLLGKSAQLQAAKSIKLAAIPGAGVVAKGTAGGLSEAGQEFSAEVITQVTGRQDKITNKDEILKPALTNAAIGAGVGTGIAATVQAVPETTDTLGKVAKIAKKGINKLSEKVEEKVTVDQGKRFDKAVANGDKVKAIDIGLEANISKIPTYDERVAHVQELFDIFDTLDETTSIEDTNRIGSKLDTTLQQITELDLQEGDSVTTKQADTVLSDITNASENDVTTAISTVVDGILSGKEIKPVTVASIKGSTVFETLPTEQKQAIEVYSEFLEASNDLQKVSSDILEGNVKEGHIGINQHRKNIARAVTLKNQGLADITLKQLVKLRAAILVKLATPFRDQKPNTDGFVRQLSSEVRAITAALNIMDTSVKTTLTSPLTAEDLKGPPIVVWTPNSSVNSTSTDTDTKVSEEAKAQLLSNIKKITDPKLKEKVLQLFNDPKRTSKKGFTALREQVKKALIAQDTTEQPDEVSPIVARADSFDALLDTEIPAPDLYNTPALQKKIVFQGKALRETYKQAIVNNDNILRAVQDIVRECNG